MVTDDVQAVSLQQQVAAIIEDCIGSYYLMGAVECRARGDELIALVAETVANRMFDELRPEPWVKGADDEYHHLQGRLSMLDDCLRVARQVVPQKEQQ